MKDKLIKGLLENLITAGVDELTKAVNKIDIDSIVDSVKSNINDQHRPEIIDIHEKFEDFIVLKFSYYLDENNIDINTQWNDTLKMYRDTFINSLWTAFKAGYKL